MDVFHGQAVLLHQSADLLNNARYFVCADFCELRFQRFFLGQQLLVGCHVVVLVDAVAKV
ncbi:protein of unknown function (plasmid) [Cupriavidus taiwanensis]|uniref:Uncharacterized protein n=1 Tax=Cupriavidus taiwanensis TaxID=164546 RepID=A0A375IR03_9BURK|nr:protein of unknown function [Cupriavidus taiwanensis]